MSTHLKVASVAFLPALLLACSEPDASLGAPAVLSNVDAACSAGEDPWYYWVELFPDEVGDWVVSRLPVEGSFQVERIEYQLRKGDFVSFRGYHCVPSLSHKVAVFKAPAGPPPAEPVFAYETDVVIPADAEPRGQRPVAVTLPTPLVVDDDEDVFVALQPTIQGEERICLSACANVVHADRSWGSNATTAPFSWTTFASGGNETELSVQVHGRPLVD